MELHTYGQDNNTLPDMQITDQTFVARKLTCDSRYRNIIGQLDAMIELVRYQAGRNMTAELERLLDSMMDQTKIEDSNMEVVGFPRAMQHRLHHQFLSNLTNELYLRSKKCQESLPKDLAYIRILWLVHFQMHDRDFEEYLLS